MTGISDESKKELSQLIAKYKLNEYKQIIESAAQGFIYILTTELDEYKITGNTRIGGVPDLPPTIEWPKTNTGYFSFVAQLNLTELPKLPNSPLPEHGILYFFLGDYPSPTKSHAVIYFNGDISSLRKAKQPPLRAFSSDIDWAVYETCQVSMVTGFTLPKWLDQAKELFESVMDVNTDSFRQWLNNRWYPMVEELEDKYRNMVSHESEISQCLGNPHDLLHHRFFHRAQLTREGKSTYSFDNEQPEQDEVKKWVLLLQLGSHDLARMAWSDMGFLDFGIHGDV